MKKIKRKTVRGGGVFSLSPVFLLLLGCVYLFNRTHQPRKVNTQTLISFVFILGSLFIWVFIYSTLP